MATVVTMPVSMRKKKWEVPFIVISAANQWDSGMIVLLS
ncbi:conserved protein of unknown function [Xenorhabdus poinarii G6]|uniref:Uncharacterized protein n=1 Tax=Xenorhabdus poinarii G6 TaxID=1354304 RepID=A0A068R4Q6_9GAMM|nr:conserved protein of unknown function [Xenorhabdus poinarii G6]